jgi:hypothetical protein
VRIILIGVVAAVTSACTVNKTMVQMDREHSRFRSPVMQAQMGKAVEDAMRGVDFAAMAGRSATVEVNGLFPQSSEDLLNYVRSSIEAKASEQGVKIIAAVPCTPSPVPMIANAAPFLCSPTVTPDYRIVVSLEEGGVQKSVRRELAPGKLAGQLSLVVGAPLTILLAGVFFFYVMPVAAIPLVAGVLWMIFSPPYDDYVRLDSRIQLVIHRMPKEGGGLTTKSEGKAAIELHPNEREGYDSE